MRALRLLAVAVRTAIETFRKEGGRHSVLHDVTTANTCALSLLVNSLCCNGQQQPVSIVGVYGMLGYRVQGLRFECVS